MKSVMVLGVREEMHPFARAARREPYRIVAGAENCAMPIRPSDTRILMESSNVQEVLQAARYYAVDGIVGVGEAASLVASSAAQRLGLPGIPHAEERLFHNQLQLRSFQEQHGLRVPRYCDLSHTRDIGDLTYPLCVSPADGHVLRHTIRVTGPEELAAARWQALRHSRDGIVIAQEDLRGRHDRQEGRVVMTDLVIRGGELQPILWCEAMLRQDTAECIPCGARYPARLGSVQQMLLAGDCARLTALLHLQDAEIPVLAYCVPGETPYLLRIGVRDGAYITTRFLSQLYRHDLLREMIRLAVGDRASRLRYRRPPEGTYRAYYTISADRTGILRHLHFKEEVRPYLRGFVRRARQSQPVSAGERDGRTIGTMMLEFPSEDEMEEILGRVASFVEMDIDVPDRYPQNSRQLSEFGL